MATLFKLVARKVRRDVIKSDPKHFNSFYSGDTGTTSNWLWESDEGLVEEDAFLDKYVFASPPSAAETEYAFSEILRAQKLMRRDTCKANLESAFSEGLVCTEPSLPISTIPPNMVQMRGPMTYKAMDILRNDKSIQDAAMKLTLTPGLWEYLKNTEAAVDLKNSCEGVDIFCSSGGSHGSSTEEPGRFVKIMNWLCDKVLLILEFLNEHGQLPGATELSEAVNPIEIMFEYKLRSSFYGAILAYLLVIANRVLKAMTVGVKVPY